jgi:hypothetical protein
MQPERFTEEKTEMKVGVITLMAVLLLALPALAGNVVDPCIANPTDTDGDTICDVIDNCSSVANASQLDSDSDGYGNRCDCDFDNNNACDGTDFGLFGAQFGSAIPPGNPNMDFDGNLAVDGTDFGIFGGLFGGLPGPACGNPAGTPCP